MGQIDDWKAQLTQAQENAQNWVQEQIWFQEIKAKWEEISPENRLYLKLGVGAVSLVSVMVYTLVSVWGIYRLKSEVYEKNDVLALVQNASVELKQIRSRTGGTGETQGGNWRTMIDQVASSAAIDKAAVEMSAEKAVPPKTGVSIQEVLYDVSVKKTNLKKAVKFAWLLENGDHPVKIRAMTIDTLFEKGTSEGYIDVKFGISGFSLKK